MKEMVISNADLAEINRLLPWHAGTSLPDGRILGRLDVGKRNNVCEIPDKRIVRLNEEISLRGLSALEVGCFEGIHTVGLRLYCDDVTAIDVRPVNVFKTQARLACHGTWAKVFQKDVEKMDERDGQFDLVFHCGVLYHLLNPAEHILALGRVARHIFLDTHIARDETRIAKRRVGDTVYSGAYHDEGGWADPFSGRDPSAFWLTQDSLLDLLGRAGFNVHNIWEVREERNGPRIALVASNR
ncbi:MAG: class I SAM-dependent methyltransferase [Porticoccaceae bacterium]